MHNPQAWIEQVLGNEPERAAFQELLEHGLRDSFRLHAQGSGYYGW